MKKSFFLLFFTYTFIVPVSNAAGVVSISTHPHNNQLLLQASFSVSSGGHQQGSYVYQDDFSLYAYNGENNTSFQCSVDIDSPMYNKFKRGLEKLADGIIIYAFRSSEGECVQYSAEFMGSLIPSPNAPNAGFIMKGYIHGDEESGVVLSNAASNPAPGETPNYLDFFIYYNNNGDFDHFDFTDTTTGALIQGDLSASAKELINSSSISTGTVLFYDRIGLGSNDYDFRIGKASFVR